MQDNKGFWDKQAELYSSDLNAVNFDLNGEELELLNIQKLLKNDEVVCDMGCGNGRTIFHMIDSNIQSVFFGIDFTKGMIKAAKTKQNSMGYDNVSFYEKSAISPNIKEMFDFKFDTVISKRLLINLKNNDKYDAIDNIYHILKPHGRYIMVENFSEPLSNINHIRNKIGLDSIKTHAFNEYLEADFLDNIKDKFELVESIDFMSLYYFISRIFNALEDKPDYKSKINMLAIEISKLGVFPVNGYAPQVLHVLKKT